MKTVSALALGVFLLAAPAFAADVDGVWTGTVNTPMGEVPARFEFKADGATVTGTTLGADGGPVPIKNGKIDGDKLTFGVTIDVGGMALEFDYKCVVSPGEIKMIAEVFGMPIEFSVKKH